jgi:hypothetical protein
LRTKKSAFAINTREGIVEMLSKTNPKQLWEEDKHALYKQAAKWLNNYGYE